MTTININDRAYKFGNKKSDRAFIRLMTAPAPKGYMTVAQAIEQGIATVDERTTRSGLPMVTVRRADGSITEFNGATIKGILDRRMAF